jgi:hypothetical protein
VVCVFARKTSEPFTSLVKQIDEKLGENSKLKAFVVVLTDQGEKTATELKELAAKAGVKHVPLTMHQDRAGLPDYELSRDADVTVLMWNHHRVKFNHAFKGELSEQDIRAIVDDVPKLPGT